MVSCNCQNKSRSRAKNKRKSVNLFAPVNAAGMSSLDLKQSLSASTAILSTGLAGTHNMGWNGVKYKTVVGACKDCPKREIGCHSTCKEYIDAKKEWKAERAKIFAEKDKTADYDNYRVETNCRRRAQRERKDRKRHR